MIRVTSQMRCSFANKGILNAWMGLQQHDTELWDQRWIGGIIQDLHITLPAQEHG